MPRKGKPSKGGIPGAFRSETRSRGRGRNKASRGCETPKTQRTRARQPRGRSLPASENAEGKRTLERRVSPRGGPPLGAVILRRRAKAHEGPAALIDFAAAAADAGKPRAGSPKRPRLRGSAEPIRALRPSEVTPAGHATPWEEAMPG